MYFFINLGGLCDSLERRKSLQIKVSSSNKYIPEGTSHATIASSNCLCYPGELSIQTLDAKKCGGELLVLSNSLCNLGFSGGWREAMFPPHYSIHTIAVCFLDICKNMLSVVSRDCIFFNKYEMPKGGSRYSIGCKLPKNDRFKLDGFGPTGRTTTRCIYSFPVHSKNKLCPLS